MLYSFSILERELEGKPPANKEDCVIKKFVLIFVLILVSFGIVSCSSEQKTPVTPIYDVKNEMVTGWEEATNEIQVIGGETFRVWSVMHQEWKELKVFEDLRLNVPLPLRVYADPMWNASNRLVVAVENEFSTNGLIIFAWLEVKSDRIVVTTSPHRLYKPK